MSNNILEQALIDIRNGRIETGQSKLRALIVEEPSNINAILWLAACTEDGAERKTLLTQALLIDSAVRAVRETIQKNSELDHQAIVVDTNFSPNQGELPRAIVQPHQSPTFSQEIFEELNMIMGTFFRVPGRIWIAGLSFIGIIGLFFPWAFQEKVWQTLTIDSHQFYGWINGVNLTIGVITLLNMLIIIGISVLTKIRVGAKLLPIGSFLAVLNFIGLIFWMLYVSISRTSCVILSTGNICTGIGGVGSWLTGAALIGVIILGLKRYTGSDLEVVRTTAEA